jgi:hypothetical protein
MFGEAHDHTVLPLDLPAAAKRRRRAGRMRAWTGREGYHVNAETPFVSKILGVLAEGLLFDW